MFIAWEHVCDIKLSFTEVTSVQRRTSSGRKLASSRTRENGLWVLKGLKGYGVATLSSFCEPNRNDMHARTNTHLTHNKLLSILFFGGRISSNLNYITAQSTSVTNIRNATGVKDQHFCFQKDMNKYWGFGVLKRAAAFNIYYPLKKKRRLLYLKTQSVPRCKHFSSRL